MRTENTLLKPSRKKPFMVIVIIIIFLVAVFGMIFILMYVLPNSNIKKATSAAAVIKSYSAPKAISGLSSTVYSQQSTGTSNIFYKLSGHNYIISIPTSNMRMFFSVNKSQINDALTIQNETTVFMDQNGLDLAKNPSVATIKDLTTTTYSNDKIICQLTSYTGSTQNISRYHTIACVDTAAINQEYIAIEKLFTIYKQTESLPAISQATRISATKDNISYSIINIVASNGFTKLLFGAVSNNWEYIGNLSSGDQKYNTGKYIITPEIAAKINDPKYKGFIATEIH